MMIRINLIGSRKKKSEPVTIMLGGRRSTVFGAAFFIELAGLATWGWMTYLGIANVKRTLTASQQQLADVKSHVADIEAVRARVKQLDVQRAAVADIMKFKKSKTTMLVEIGRILSDQGPTSMADRKPEFNPGWNFKKVWLKSLSESDQNLRVTGVATDFEDLAEVSRRFEQSRVFKSFAFVNAKREKDISSKEEFVSFTFQVGVTE